MVKKRLGCIWSGFGMGFEIQKPNHLYVCAFAPETPEFCNGSVVDVGLFVPIDTSSFSCWCTFLVGIKIVYTLV